MLKYPIGLKKQLVVWINLLSQSKPEDYVKVATDFVTEQAQTSPKFMSEFAEIAKRLN